MAISKKLSSLGESASNLEFICGIFTFAKEKSRESEFTKADTYKGLSIVYGEKLRQGDYSGEEEKMRLQESKTECETKSNVKQRARKSMGN